MVFGYQALKLRDTVRDGGRAIAAAEQSAAAATRTAEVAVQQMIIANRPYIVLPETQSSWVRNTTDRGMERLVFLHWDILNAGKTPASSVQVDLAHVLGPIEARIEPMVWNENPEGINADSFGPGVGGMSAPLVLNEAQVWAIFHEQIQAVFAIRVRYRDFFPNTPVHEVTAGMRLQIMSDPNEGWREGGPPMGIVNVTRVPELCTGN